MSPEEDEPGAHASRGRWRKYAAAGTFVVAIGVTFAIARATVTPAEQAAERAAPPQRPVLVSPVRQKLRDLRIATCTLSATEQALRVPAGTEAPTAVFTRVDIGKDQPVASGSVVVEISGRPLIALDLPFPLYRDISPGDTGPDVTAVQEALGRLDRYSQTPTGVFDRPTEAAIEQLYADLDTSPSRTGADLDEAARTAEQAEADLRATAEAGEPVTNREYQAAVDTRRAAQDRIGIRLPMSEIIVAPAGMMTHHVRARVGAPADAGSPIAVLRGPHAAVTCTLAATGADGLEAEQDATLQTPSGSHPGTITAPSTEDETVTVGFIASEGPLPEELAGQSGSLEVNIASTDGQVLAVPAAALRERPGGGHAVAVANADGTTRSIEVELGVIADGLVEVTNGKLDIDDELVVAVESNP